MVSIRRVTDGEVELARELHNQFTTQEKSMAQVRSWYSAVPELFLFAVEDGAVIGVCTGRPRGEREVSLAGIGIESDRRGEGIGTRLIERFEDTAREIGVERFTVVSAGVRVDEFYLDSGFSPESILVMNPAEGPDAYTDTEFDIEWDRNEDGSDKCYVTVTDYDPAVLESVRNVFDDHHATYIMTKPLDTRQ